MYVYILKGLIKDSIKCFTSNCSEKDIIDTHKKVYQKEISVTKKCKIFNADLFNEYLQKIPQYRTSFVTISFGLESPETSFPPSFYSDEQIGLIEKLIESINTISSLISSERETFGNEIDTLISLNNEPNGFTFLFKLLLIRGSHRLIAFQNILIFNEKNVFIYETFCQVFPEFIVNKYSFPMHKLAEEMLYHKINSQRVPQNLDLVITKIKDFFEDDDLLAGLSANYLSISDFSDTQDDIEEESNNIQKIVSDFYDYKCVTDQSFNSKIQSSELYTHFKNWYLKLYPNSFHVTQTRFSLTLKRLKPFLKSKRTSSGNFFLGIKLK